MIRPPAAVTTIPKYLSFYAFKAVKKVGGKPIDIHLIPPTLVRWW
jgi:hypothetical protein